ncbi:MAG: DUF3996 domain-containing protein [Deltaproteobacteria bacterium]|nr:DUF3996 domain-containing protein [Deltaproteobacteria bacterium]
MRNYILAVIMTAIIFVCGTAQAESKDGFGIGFIIGEPTGLSMKKWIGNDRAIDLGIAWSFSENNSFHLHADYLFHRFDLLPTQKAKGQLPLYFGLGARLKLKDENDDRGRNDNDNLLGLRVPIGISYLFADHPFDLFAEIVPVLDLAPDTKFDLNIAVGARFYF